MQKAIPFLWIIGCICLLLYSYTQIDLSLTLSSASFVRDIQTAFQYIGYFNRSLSSYLYIGLVTFLFILFCLTYVYLKKITTKALWGIVIVLAIFLIPSYNAFSYDFFNYIFDARIVSNYHLSPYEFKPLDFPNDAMLSFMRSTHRVYPYGPSWLVLTVPLTFFANEVFLVSLFLFKLVSSLSFVGSAFFIWKIAKKIKIDEKKALLLFALNPLVLIEGLVSSHNEIVMMFFAVLSLYLFLNSKKTLSFVSLLISIGVKYATLVMLPVFILKMFYSKLKDSQFIFCLVFVTLVAVVITSIASGQNKNPEFQPWYLLLAAPFVALCENKYISWVFAVVSFASLFMYVPYLALGEWPVNIVELKNQILVFGSLVAILTLTVYFFVSRKKLHKRQ